MGLISEIKRRNVHRMAALYVVVAWLILQVAEVVTGLANLPEWAGPLILGLLAIGFPIALALSWFYELTAQGIEVEAESESGRSVARLGDRRLDFVVIALLAAAVVMFAYDKWWARAPTDLSIAVLPFQNISADPEQEYFSDGIAEETHNLLAGIKSLRVLAWTTARTFRERNADIATIAGELGVSHVLEGSVRKSGDRVRVTAQLIDAANGAQLWSQKYERQLTAENLFKIQEDIATSLAGRLRASLTPEESQRLQKVPTRDTEAYAAYLKGRQGIARATTDSLLEAAGHLQYALERDPSFAAAHAALARAYWIYNGITQGKLPEGVTVESAMAHIDRALALDPDLALAHTMRGKVLAMQGDRDGAMAEYERAIELGQNDPEVYLVYGGSQPDDDRQLEVFREGLRIDPGSPRLNSAAGWKLIGVGRPNEAVAHFKRAIESDPEALEGYSGLAVVNWHYNGRLDESMRWLRLGYGKDPNNINNICLIGWLYLFLGDDETAERWFRHALSLAPNSAGPKIGLTDVYHQRDWHEQEWAMLDEMSGAFAMDRKWHHLIYDGRFEEVDEWFRSHEPEALIEGQDLADALAQASSQEALEMVSGKLKHVWVLRGLGETERADAMLSQLNAYLEQRMVTNPWDYDIYSRLYLALGQKEEAIAALRKRFEGGYLYFWQPHLKERWYDAIRDEPAFQALVDEVSGRMAVQLERVREMERNGEIPLLPEDAEAAAP